MSVHSAYINETGVGSDVIDFTDNFSSTKTITTLDMTQVTDRVVHKQIPVTSHSTSVSIEFYLNATTEGGVTLPRNSLSDSYNLGTDGIYQQFFQDGVQEGTNPDQIKRDDIRAVYPLTRYFRSQEQTLDDRYRFKYDGSRYTIMCSRYPISALDVQTKQVLEPALALHYIQY